MLILRFYIIFLYECRLDSIKTTYMRYARIESINRAGLCGGRVVSGHSTLCLVCPVHL